MNVVLVLAEQRPFVSNVLLVSTVPEDLLLALNARVVIPTPQGLEVVPLEQVLSMVLHAYAIEDIMVMAALARS